MLQTRLWKKKIIKEQKRGQYTVSDSGSSFFSTYYYNISFYQCLFFSSIKSFITYCKSELISTKFAICNIGAFTALIEAALIIVPQEHCWKNSPMLASDSKRSLKQHFRHCEKLPIHLTSIIQLKNNIWFSAFQKRNFFYR